MAQRLTSFERERLAAALHDAFPNRSDLEQLALEIGGTLDDFPDVLHA
jgi:hypothetical protein